MQNFLTQGSVQTPIHRIGEVGQTLTLGYSYIDIGILKYSNGQSDIDIRTFRMTLKLATVRGWKAWG